MKFAITGLNHRTAPVEVRERLNFDQNALGPALAELKRLPGVQEGMVLCTCNRVEVSMWLDDAADARALGEQFLASARAVPREFIAPYLYCHEEADAIRHLFRVAASLDSMVVGEPQILGQLKSAYALAKAHGAIAGALEFLLTRAFHVAKRVRTETGIGENAVSVSYVAVELARQIFGKLDRSRIMLVGAGKMSELAARHLKRAGAEQILVTNRTHARAVEMASQFCGRVVEYERFRELLPEVDIVITSSAAPLYILRKEEMRRIIEARRNRPMFLIDIAVPRNIDPAVNELDNVFLYDIDDLQRVASENLRSRLEEAREAEGIIEEEVRRTTARLKAREVTPTIISLQQHLESLRQAELERIQAKLDTLKPEQREAVEAMTRSLINKIAHGPISELRRQAAQPDGLATIETIRRVFRLES